MTAPNIAAPAAATRADDRRAIGLILLAMFAFCAQDVMVKLILDQASIWQSQLVRSIIVIALLTMIAVCIDKAPELRPATLFWPTIRAVFMCGAYLLFYASLVFLSLSVASAAFFIGPMLITLLAALILREPIGPRRIAAVIVGFVGVLFILRPDGDFELAALLPLGAAVSYALGVVITRWRCRADPAMALSVIHNAFYAAVAALGIAILDLWPWPDLRAAQPALAMGWPEIGGFIWLLLAATALTHTVGALASVRAYQISDASRIAPFEYSYLAIAPVWDVLLWDAVPAVATLFGMALIAGSGGYVAWREGRPARARPQNYGEIPWTEDSPTPEPGPDDR